MQDFGLHPSAVVVVVVVVVYSVISVFAHLGFEVGLLGTEEEEEEGLIKIGLATSVIVAVLHGRADTLHSPNVTTQANC